MSKNNSFYGRVNILKKLSERDAHVHFVGSSGVGMSSLLILSSYFGISVSGEDRKESECVDALRKIGNINIGRHKKIPGKTSLLVYTLAVDEKHESLKEAEALGIPAVSRAEYMSALIEPFITKIGVSGTHGKSTTTAMLAGIFKEAKLMPTTICGAPLFDGGKGIEIGTLDYLIYESCEYKNSFLCFEPSFSLFLNLEYDHPDFFESFETLSLSFYEAMKKARRVVVNYDDIHLREIAKKLDTSAVFFGKERSLEYSYEGVAEESPAFVLFYKGDRVGEIKLSIIGEFNIENALAAAAVAHEVGIPFSIICKALSDFGGIPRRLERIGDWRHRSVYYDYAHHPTEIKGGIEAIKSHTGKPLTVIFSPHTYSRTKALLEDFKSSLSLSDYRIITEICAIREKKSDGINGRLLAEITNGHFCESSEHLIKLLSITEGDIVIMGAGDVEWIKRALNL